MLKNTDRKNLGKIRHPEELLERLSCSKKTSRYVR